MEKTCDYSICSGCGVCATVCPKDCISFSTGDFGHIYPRIDTEKCIDCKKCQKVCPSLNNFGQQFPKNAFAGIINNKADYLSSTSGGAAQALSLGILKDGGVVYGCASLDEGRVEHIRVGEPNKLVLLKGSKYVQSDVSKVYKQILHDIKDGTQVLFIGTPCQCAAVKALFKSPPTNLSLVELICHGVPSQKYLFKCLEKKGVNRKEIGRLTFRTEKGYQLVVYDNEGHNFEPIYESNPLFDKGCKDMYYKTFFYGYSFRPGCYTCKFARSERVADITIGDFWGLGVELPANEIPPHKHGISVILPCTSKGEELLNKVSDLINLYPRPVEEAINGNHQLQHPTKKGVDVRLFNFLRRIVGVSLAFQISFFIRRVCGFVKRKLGNG